MSMRLIKRGNWFHVQLRRGKSQSLKTQDASEAQALFREIEKEVLRGRLLHLEDCVKITLSDFLRKYINSRPAYISKWTIKKDELSLKLLGDVIGDVQLRAITRAKVEDFKRACLARGTAPITVNGYLRHIKSALRWAHEEEYLDKLPIIKMYRKQEEKPRVLSPHEIKKLLRASFKYDKDLGRRFFVHCYTGARRRELANLKWQDIDWQSGKIQLRGKGNKTRTVPLLAQVEKILLPVKKDIGPVFKDLHVDTISHRFETVARTCGITARLHDLRHTCATYLMKSGVDLPTVQAILGHAAISTTQIYAKVLDDQKKSQMSRLRFA